MIASGARGRKAERRAAARRVIDPQVARFSLGRLSLTTMVPADKVGARNCSNVGFEGIGRDVEPERRGEPAEPKAGDEGRCLPIVIAAQNRSPRIALPRVCAVFGDAWNKLTAGRRSSPQSACATGPTSVTYVGRWYYAPAPAKAGWPHRSIAPLRPVCGGSTSRPSRSEPEVRQLASTGPGYPPAR